MQDQELSGLYEDCDNCGQVTPVEDITTGFLSRKKVCSNCKTRKKRKKKKKEKLWNKTEKKETKRK